MDWQDTFTDTSTRISSMVIALCLKSVAVMDRQDTFTDTSTRISSMLITLWLQSVAAVDQQTTFTAMWLRTTSGRTRYRYHACYDTDIDGCKGRDTYSSTIKSTLPMTLLPWYGAWYSLNTIIQEHDINDFIAMIQEDDTTRSWVSWQIVATELSPCRVHVCMHLQCLPIKENYGRAGYVDDPLPNIVYMAIWMPACVVWLYYASS